MSTRSILHRSRLTGDVHRGTVTDINRDLAETLKQCGPAILINDQGILVPQITNQVLSILTKRHPCQQDLGDEADEDVMEESSEYDWLVIDTAMDVVTALSIALGHGFAELWKVFEKPVMKYASSQESLERNTAVGCIADAIGNMESNVTPHTTALLKLLLHRLGDEDPEVKSNAVYAIGLLCEKSNSEQEILKAYPTILGKLEPLLHDQQVARLLDNAAGCVSRMIMRHPGHVPVQQVLPSLVQLLPLREDYDENKPVYRMIVQLCKSSACLWPGELLLTGIADQAHNDTVVRLTPNLMPVLQKVLGPPEDQLDDETRSQLMELVSYLQKQ